MKPIEIKAQQLLINQWNAVYEHLDQFQLIQIKPNDGYGLFKLCEQQKFEDSISFSVGPATFLVPERANQMPELYVVVRGLLHLDNVSLQANALKTSSFATEVGYFREKSGKLEHVYGAHYDFSYDELGHPTFHAQMKSYIERGKVVVDHFELASVVDEDSDPLKKLLNRVRVPTAQMDFFALILQLVADHLIDKHSREDALEIFTSLKKVNLKIQGAGYKQMSFQNAPSCMRSHYWYV